MPTAVYIGHSYIARMGQMLQDDPYLQNGPPDLRWRFVGRGGAKLSPYAPAHKNIFNLVWEVASWCPDIVYVHCGENDLGEMHPYDIAERLIQLIHDIIHTCRPNAVVISHLTPFPKLSSLGMKTRMVNHRLRVYCRNRDNFPPFVHVRMWKHRIGIAGPDRLRWYSRDDIHLNYEGMRRYIRSSGTAVSRTWLAWC